MPVAEDYFKMADPRLGAHQQFDALRCRLCNNIYAEPKLLGCLHSFCLPCLEKYEAETSDISANQIPCPICKVVIDLPPVGGVKSLTDNTLIKRYIAQAHRDKTKMVAGREVLELQRQALTETDLSCPEIVSSIQQIADTAGQIIAGGIEEQSQVHDFDTVKIRQDLQVRTANLQEKALDIISAIDRVNQEVVDWTYNRNRVRDKIKARSAEIQGIVQGIERRLLASIDDKEMETELKNSCFATKTTLHKTLKTDLTAVEFMKLLAEFGDANDLEKFMPIVAEQERAILEKTVPLKTDSYMFDHPTVDVREGLEMMFGGLTKCEEEKAAWDARVSRRLPSSSEESSLADVESQLSTPKHGLKTDSKLLTNYTEVNENNEDDSHEFRSRFSKRFEQANPKLRRRPMKSMSFDEGVRARPLIMPAHHQNPQAASSENEESGENNRDENPNSASNHVQADVPHENHDRIHSVIQSLNPNTERKSWARRVSAPSTTIIDTLNRRRLNALSILERANISTEGLNMTSDVESGLSEARLEWLRDNFHRKMGNVRKQSSVDEEV